MAGDTVNTQAIIEGFVKLCRKKGLRATHQRTEIFKALSKHPDHPTTEEIFRRVRKHLKTISLDTVYRTIATFEEHGLIRRIYHVDNTTRFDINVSNHHHLVCARCNTIEDFYWPEFDRMKPPRSVADRTQIDTKQVIINGLCSSCKEML